MTIGIVGARSIKEASHVWNYLDKIFAKYPDAEIVSGDCNEGPDYHALSYCRYHGKDITLCCPGYDINGVEGYFMRNKRIVDRSVILCAWHDGISKGTMDSIKYAESVGKIKDKNLFIFNV